MNQARFQYSANVLFKYWDFEVVRVVRALQDLLPQNDDRAAMLELFLKYFEQKNKTFSDTQNTDKERFTKFCQRGLLSFLRELSVTELRHNFDESLTKWLKNYDPRPNVTLTGAPLDLSQFHLQEVLIPHHSYLDDAGKQQYKRLVIQAQDALSMRNFGRSYELCQQVCAETEPESAQLYELMMLAFLNAETPKNIISDALQLQKVQKMYRAANLEGTESSSSNLESDIAALPKLQTLLLLVQRCASLQKAFKCPSETADDNIKKVAQLLFDELSDAYLNIKFDYVQDAETKNDPRREATQRWIETAWLIHEQIATAHQYFEQQFVRLMVEIAGGGKFQWLAVAKNQTHQIHDNSDLDALQLFEHIRNWLALQPLARANMAHAIEELSNFADQLQFKIGIEKYFGLKILAKKSDKKRDPELRQKAIDLLDAAEIAHHLTQRTEFLDQIIGELTDEGIFSWIDLAKNPKISENKNERKLIFENNAPARKLDFDAVGELLRIADKGKRPLAPVFDRLELGIAKHIAAQTEQRYLQLMGRLNRFLPVKADERREIWSCLQDFERCYKILWDEALIKRCLGELTGYGILLWFDFDEKTNKLVTHRQATELKIDALKTVRRWIDEKNPEHLAPLTHETTPQYVAQKLYDFARHVLETPDQNQLYNREFAIKLFRNIEKSSEILKDKKILITVINEIIREYRFNWIDLTTTGMISTPESNALGFDAVKNVTRLIEQYDPNLITEIRKFVADKHASESMKDYTENVADDKKNNNIRDRERVVEAIWQLKNCFLLHQDARYLKMPLDELTGNGKIEWYQYKFFSHSDNKTLGFDVFKEKEQFLNWQKTYFLNGN